MDAYYIFALCIGAYLLGSIPFGKIIAHSHGIDIQKKGSGNIGFANVRRIVGWQAGYITLFADITKGLASTVTASVFFSTTTAFIVGVIAIIGHIFPVWLKFHGGKGIATGLGVVLALQPIAGVIGAFIYTLALYITKISSTSSLIGLIATAGIGVILTPSYWWCYLVLSFIALWTLRQNIAGTVPNYDK